MIRLVGVALDGRAVDWIRSIEGENVVASFCRSGIICCRVKLKRVDADTIVTAVNAAIDAAIDKAAPRRPKALSTAREISIFTAVTNQGISTSG
jgi:hypothetical protein